LRQIANVWGTLAGKVEHGLEDFDSPVQLSYMAVAYVAMFYAAAAILLAGLLAKIWNSIRHPAPLKATVAPLAERPISGTVRLAGEVVLFRSAFFRDRWNWVFGTCFHFGLLLVLVRHLRYALDPSWCGKAVWQLITIAQPFGIYGGFALVGGVLGFSLRRVVLKRTRQQSGVVDHILLVLLLAVPLTGFASVFVHSDVVAVKDFFVGLATGDLKPLPVDGLLLLHLWLVAVLMVTLPFGKMLHFADIFEAVSQGSSTETQKARRIKMAAGVVLALLLAVPAGMAVGQVVSQGWRATPADFSTLAKIHRKEDPTVMIRNHPDFLVHEQDIVVFNGARSTDQSIERCVTCHVTKDANGQPVDFENPKHFCTECHNRAAVTIDCFECHNSKPMPSGQASLDTPSRFAKRSPLR
jgi:nitrate reductase gamma subunit